MKWFFAVTGAALGLFMLNIALAAFLWTVMDDRLDELATKDQLAALAATSASKDQLAAFAAITTAKFEELDARVAALASVSWDPDTPVLTSDSNSASDFLYFGPKPGGSWSTVLEQLAQEPGVNVQQVDPSYSWLDYLRGQGASSIPENLKSPLEPR